MFWNVPIKAVQIGFTEMSAIDGSQAGWTFRRTLTGCLDSGTTQVLVPESFYEEFINILLKDKNGTYDEESDSYYGSCDLKKYESVYIAIGNNFYEIPPAKYVNIDDQEEFDVTVCGINFG